MPQQAAPQGSPTGLYVNPAAALRDAFAQAWAPRFAHLALADGAEAALACIERAPPDLLVIDLEGCDPDLDGGPLARLVAARAGAPVLLLCPAAGARWLPLLMARGPLAYAITPLADAALEALLAQAPAPAAASPSTLELATLRAKVRTALFEGEDLEALGERLCRAVYRWPGVAHAALFCLQPGGDLRLQAQYGQDVHDARNGLDLARLLGRADRLLQAPLRHAFPGLVAAASGATVLLDAPQKAGDARLAAALQEHGIGMVLGLPVRAHGAATPRGALCLLFKDACVFSREQLLALEELADLAALGLRMVDLNRENEEMLVRVTRLSTLDALTGAANRLHGETLLEQEVKRARRYGAPLALIAFDIDRFRDVNERYGHPVGDIVLRCVAEATRALLRASDILVRAGGEEFLVIAAHTSAVEALTMAEKLRAAVEATTVPGADGVTVSLGVAGLAAEESADSLTVRANAALARAKRAGRNCVELALG